VVDCGGWFEMVRIYSGMKKGVYGGLAILVMSRSPISQWVMMVAPPDVLGHVSNQFHTSPSKRVK